MALRKRKHYGKKAGSLGIENSGFYPYLMQYIEAIKVNGTSPDTLRRHLRNIRHFVVWCDERELQRPQDVTKSILERYKRHLYYYRKRDGEPLTQGSQNVMLTPIKAFFRWLTRENQLLYNPAAEWAIPRKLHKLPRTILAYETVEKILAQPDVSTPQGIRDRTILEVFYSSDIRRQELSALDVPDVDIIRKVVNIQEGKGLKSRVLPIGGRPIQWVERYTHDVRPLLLSPLAGDALFLTDFGERFDRSYLGALVRRYIEMADVDARGACHLFRHAMATHMHDNGADIRNIQVLLGHEDLTSTQIYTQVSVEKLRTVHKATHPVERSHMNLPPT